MISDFSLLSLLIPIQQICIVQSSHSDSARNSHTPDFSLCSLLTTNPILTCPQTLLLPPLPSHFYIFIISHIDTATLHASNFELIFVYIIPMNAGIIFLNSHNSIIATSDSSSNDNNSTTIHQNHNH